MGFWKISKCYQEDDDKITKELSKYVVHHVLKICKGIHKTKMRNIV